MRGRGDWRWIAVAGVALVSIGTGEPSWAGYGSQGTAAKPDAPPVVPPPPCGNPTNAGDEPPAPSCGCESPPKNGHPVVLFNGAFVHERTDLVVNGVVPIEVIRRYDSSSTYDSPVGYGWSLNWDVRLYDVGDEIVVRTRCGQQDRYEEPDGTGPAIAEPADPARGPVAELERLASGLYVVNYPGGSRAFFDNAGRLESLQNPQGNRLRITYKSATRQEMKGIPAQTVTPGAAQPVAMVFQIDRVSEELFDRSLGTPAFVPTGRFVEFAYDANGRLQSATASDLRSVTYVHDTVTGGTSGNLIQVNGLAGLVDVYGYTDTNDIHDLTSVQEGQGGTGGTPPVAPLVIQYGNGRVELETLGQTQWDFVYPTPENFTRKVRRTVVNASGSHIAETNYTFDASGFLLQKIDESGTKFEYVRNVPTGDTLVDQILVSESNGSGGFNLVRAIDQVFENGRLKSRTVRVRPGPPAVDRIESWEYDGHWLKAYQVVQSDRPNDKFRTEYTFYRNGLHDGELGYQATDPITNIYEIQRAVTSPGGVPVYQVTALEYDAFGQLTRITPPVLAVDPDGFAIVLTYFNLEETTVATRGLLETIAIHAPTEIPELRREFSYDSKGFLDLVEDAREHTTSFDWDDRGRLKEITNHLSEKTLFTYGAPNASSPDNTQPGAYLVRIERGKQGAAEGQIQRLLWDARGFLTGIQRKNDAAGFDPFVTYAHDSDGNRIRSIDGRGEVRTWTYDDLGRALTFSDHSALWSGSVPPALHTTLFQYDAFGNRRKVTDDKGRVTDFVFDGVDRLVSVTQQGASLVTAFEYDAAGNVTKVTDPKLQGTNYTYDLLSRLGSVQQPGLETVSYLYDARSRLSKTTNARGQALLYEYFAFGGLKEVVHDLDDDGEETGERKVSYTYDNNGNVTTTKDTSLLGGATLQTFTYDELDRVDTTIAHYIDGEPIVDARYDRFGNRDQLTLSDGATLRHQWAYDSMNRLVAACLPQDATAVDPCTPTSGTKTLGFTPLANDRLSALAHENGLVTNFAYEPFGPIESITVGSAPPYPQQLVYGYDELLNVTTIAETQNGSAVSPDFGFQYDAVYRLAEADYPTIAGLPPSPGETFGYDPAGNRDDNPSSATPWAYDTNNRLTRSPDVELYCYDADGNLTSTRDDEDTCESGDDIRSFTWDAKSRLLSFSEGSTSASYAYDPLGRRIQKAVGGVETFYLWDGDRLLAEYDGSGNRTVRYAYAQGFAPVQVAYAGSPETIHDVHSDHLDTPRMLTASSGMVSWRASYEAFGNAHVSDDPDGSIVTLPPDFDFNLRFPGQYYDAESGLHQNRFRYYDPDVGRYISADPIGQRGILAKVGVFDPGGLVQTAAFPSVDATTTPNGLNIYGYVSQNSVNSLDLLGLYESADGEVDPEGKYRQYCETQVCNPDTNESCQDPEYKNECVRRCIARYASAMGALGASGPSSEISTGVGFVDAVQEWAGNKWNQVKRWWNGS